MIQIIKFDEKYSDQIADLFEATIRTVCSQDYTPEEIDAWIGTAKDYPKWRKRLRIKQPIIAIENNRVLGFAELEPPGHIDCFYVDKDFQGKGIGRKLMSNIEEAARGKGYLKFIAEVSITAKPFFIAMGFFSIRPNLVKIKGQNLKNYIIEKALT